MRRTGTTAAFLAALAMCAGPAAAQNAPAAPNGKKRQRKTSEEETVRVPLNGSKLVRFDQGLSRVQVGSDIADVAAYPPNEVLITGKKLGATTLTVWKGGSRIDTIAVSVGYPGDLLAEVLAEAIPEVQNLKVTDLGASLVISGEVPSAADVERADEIAKGVLPGGTKNREDPVPTIVNLLRVTGDQQVQLEIAFAEVSRSALKQIGVNLFTRSPDNWTAGMFSPLTQAQMGLPGVPTSTPGGPLATELGPSNPAGTNVVVPPLTGAFNVLFGLGNDYGFPFAAALSLLSNRGYARTLAEPTLVALSGKKASFLAGGEFPMPLPGALGQVTIEFKKFGVQLEFLPTVVDGVIQLDVDMTVSDLDFSLGIKLANVTVPGLIKRHSSTTIRLRDGQSFAIAGLLSDKVRSSVDKVPWLGDLPILGTLFRSSRYQREETELLVVVTARMARPQGERPALPGEDETADPSDLELFFLGSHESKESSVRRDDGPSGPVGFKR